MSSPFFSPHILLFLTPASLNFFVSFYLIYFSLLLLLFLHIIPLSSSFLCPPSPTSPHLSCCVSYLFGNPLSSTSILTFLLSLIIFSNPPPFLHPSVLHTPLHPLSSPLNPPISLLLLLLCPAWRGTRSRNCVAGSNRDWERRVGMQLQRSPWEQEEKEEKEEEEGEVESKYFHFIPLKCFSQILSLILFFISLSLILFLFSPSALICLWSFRGPSPPSRLRREWRTIILSLHPYFCSSVSPHILTGSLTCLSPHPLPTCLLLDLFFSLLYLNTLVWLCCSCLLSVRPFRLSSQSSVWLFAV